MQVRTQTQLQVTVELAEPEAKWLRDLLQNSIAAYELQEHSEFRRNLFELLRQRLTRGGDGLYVTETEPCDA